MKALQIQTVEQYIQLLEARTQEADQLFKDLLIGVTSLLSRPWGFKALGKRGHS